MKTIDKERQMIREAAEKTAQRIVQPRAAEIDASQEFPPDLIEALGKQGFFSILLPEQFGGTNGDVTSFCLVIEEIAKVCGSSSLLILAQGLGILPVLLAGDSSQKERCLTQISEENRLAAFALSELEAGSDASSLRTRAQRQGKGYLLNGRKRFVTNGSMAQFYSVFAVTDPGKGSRGISSFVVDDRTPGLRFGPREKKVGMRGLATTDLIFEDCMIPQENRLGEEGGGWQTAMRSLTVSRPAVGAQAVGIAQGALDFAIGYANERSQFGKPIASFQAIQFMIADMATLVEAARALVYQTAGKMNSLSGGPERLSPMARSFASDVAMRVTTDAVQILGGYGYMRDYPVERMMRDAKVTQIYDGANQIQKLVLADHLLPE